MPIGACSRGLVGRKDQSQTSVSRVQRVSIGRVGNHEDQIRSVEHSKESSVNKVSAVTGSFQQIRNDPDDLPLFPTQPPPASTIQTRNSNFRAMRARGDHKAYRARILGVFAQNGGKSFTNLELATTLSLPINCITSPVLQLRSESPPKLVPAGVRKCRISGHRAQAWRINR